MVAHVVAVVDSREGRCNSAEGSEKSEGLGEHFVLFFRVVLETEK
jgi:hypothetical protein